MDDDSTGLGGSSKPSKSSFNVMVFKSTTREPVILLAELGLE